MIGGRPIKLLFAAAIIGSLTLPADAYFLWPWQRHAWHHRVQPEQPPPDCAEINAVKQSMTPERYEHALRQTTKEQQKIIADCAGQP